MNHLIQNKELAPCGVFCGACPSFERSCMGCASADRSQQRASKWSCPLRTCCYDTKGLNYCIECRDFPCSSFNRKLLSRHREDPRYHYRFEITAHFPKLPEMRTAQFLEYQRERYTCSRCGGRMIFYHNRCRDCNA